MKKFMLTLLVLMPIALVCLVAFSAALIIREASYYPIEGIKVAWKDGSNAAPRVTLRRGESFDFFADNMITVYPARASVKDIVIVLEDSDLDKNAANIIDIEEGVVTAKQNLSNEFEGGIYLKMVNREGAPIKYKADGKEVPHIKVNIIFDDQDPIDDVRFDLDYMLDKQLDEASNAEWLVALENKDNKLVVHKDAAPTDKPLQIINALIVSPSAYFKVAYFAFGSSDDSVVDIVDMATSRFCIDVRDVGSADITFVLTVPNGQTKTATLSINIV